MAFVSSKDSRVAVGLINLSGYARGYQANKTTEMLDTTTLADTSKQYIVGMTSGSVTLDMLLDSSGAANGQFDVLKSWGSASPYPITLAPAGFATGSLAYLINGIQTELSTSAAIGDVVAASASGQATGIFDVGAVVEDFAAVTIDTTGTARDFTAASSNGGVAHLHISAFSGLTSNAIRIEHSVDGATSWATLLSFTTATGVTSERVEVAAGTTIRRYLRVVDDVTGTGSCTRLVAFARR